MHGEYTGKRNVEEKLLEFCDEKELFVADTWFPKQELKNITYNVGGNKIGVQFVMVGKIESIKKMLHQFSRNCYIRW